MWRWIIEGCIGDTYVPKAFHINRLLDGIDFLKGLKSFLFTALTGSSRALHMNQRIDPCPGVGEKGVLTGLSAETSPCRGSV